MAPAAEAMVPLIETTIATVLGLLVDARPASGVLLPWLSERTDALRAQMIAKHGEDGDLAFEDGMPTLG